MYRVIVVDDEPWSLIGIRKILEEYSERFDVVYETTSPVDALEKIGTMNPDVVFTDVRMPEINGIELIQKVRESGIVTEFVVISGFAEFSYVQQALQEGAIDYQLKPFDKNAMKKTLDKIIHKLESKNKANDLEIYSLIRDNKTGIADLLKKTYKKPLYENFQTVLVYYKKPDFPKRDFDLGEKGNSTCLKVGPRKVVYIMNYSDDKTRDIYENLRMIDKEIEKAALSRVNESPDFCAQMIQEAENTILDFFVYPEDKVFEYKRPQNHVTNHIEEIIMSLYDDRKFQQLKDMMEKLPQMFAGQHMGVADAVYLWNRIALRSVIMHQDDNRVLESLDVYGLTEQFADIREMSDYLKGWFSQEGSDRTGTVNDKFFEMLRYIDKHYSEDLLLKELCNKFYINMSYCCELFRKYKNMTFSQYLTDIRISNACELLKYRKTTISDACEMVGYKDYFYFNKVFKKKVGCTPSEYRKNEGRDN